MRIDLYTKAILTIIALLLAVMVIHPITRPQQVAAQVSNPGIGQGIYVAFAAGCDGRQGIHRPPQWQGLGL